MEVSNVINIVNIIYRCRSLINPPYISKWNFNKEIKKDSIFGKSEFSNSSNYSSILNSFNNSKSEEYLNQNNISIEKSNDGESFYNNE